MKFKSLILIIAFSTLLTISTMGTVFSQQASTCQSPGVCVHPGDLLRYAITLGVANSSQIFTFGDMVDKNHIKVVEQYTLDQNKTGNNTMTLDLKTGIISEDNILKPFFVVLPTPIQYNKTNNSIIQGLTDFNGFKRTDIVALESRDNSTSKMEYDMETGILLNAHSISLMTILNKPELVQFSEKLLETNIINSDSTGLQGSKNTTSIPSWVKNNAKWWSEDQIDDSSFIKAMQYLISNGIMQVPHGSTAVNSSQKIPNWIKSNAGWWSEGKITDGDFVSGIQYLITVGIIKV